MKYVQKRFLVFYDNFSYVDVRWIWVLQGVSEREEETFGKYVVSELKRIKKKKTYELVKWEILQALQKAILLEVETDS